MDRLQNVAGRVSRAGAIVGGALLLIASIVISIDITLRYTVSRTLGGADELSGYALAISSAWGLSTALLTRSHIRIDTVYVRVPFRVRPWLDFLSLAVFTGFFALVAWHGWGVVAQSWTSGSRSMSTLETPVVIPQALWLIGLLFLIAVAALLMVRALAAFLAGDLIRFFELIGSKSALAEAKEEIEAVERGFAREREK